MAYLNRPAVPAVAPDVEVGQVSADSISDLAFCPAADILAASSWNGEVRMYAVDAKCTTRPLAGYAHDGPALSLAWTKDGSKLFSGGADNFVRMFDTSTGTGSLVGQHDAPVKCVRSVETPGGTILATGSWDKTLRYWDLRQPAPIASVQLAGRCYSMDTSYPLLIVGSSEEHLQVINLAEPTKLFQNEPSPLKMQTRVVACFPSGDGYAVGGIGGRVAIQWTLPDKSKPNNYMFRCHRDDTRAGHTIVYAVNCVKFHPTHTGSFLTGGSDGTMSIWDRDAKARIKSFPTVPGPIAATAFNNNGSLLAYAVSYDWSKGHGHMKSDSINKIMLHPMSEDEVKRKR